MSARERAVPRLRLDTPHRLQSGDELEAHALGRRCVGEGCDARLSRYNPSDTCGLHSGWANTRKRRPYGG